jgi:hypothetical protein
MVTSADAEVAKTLVRLVRHLVFSAGDLLREFRVSGLGFRV